MVDNYDEIQWRASVSDAKRFRVEARSGVVALYVHPMRTNRRGEVLARADQYDNVRLPRLASGVGATYRVEVYGCMIFLIPTEQNEPEFVSERKQSHDDRLAAWRSFNDSMSCWISCAIEKGDCHVEKYNRETMETKHWLMRETETTYRFLARVQDFWLLLYEGHFGLRRLDDCLSV